MEIKERPRWAQVGTQPTAVVIVTLALPHCAAFVRSGRSIVHKWHGGRGGFLEEVGIDRNGDNVRTRIRKDFTYLKDPGFLL